MQEVNADERLRTRQQQSRPVVDKLHGWLTLHRAKVPEGSATAKAMDYSLRRWTALTRFVDDGHLPVDNNWVENQMRPVARWGARTGYLQAHCELANAPLR